MLTDGLANGWPREILVSTSIEIAEPPSGALRGPVARTPELTLAWGGADHPLAQALLAENERVTGLIAELAMTSSRVASFDPR
jgi:hypothetical protein